MRGEGQAPYERSVASAPGGAPGCEQKQQRHTHGGAAGAPTTHPGVAAARALRLQLLLQVGIPGIGLGQLGRHLQRAPLQGAGRGGVGEKGFREGCAAGGLALRRAGLRHGAGGAGAAAAARGRTACSVCS